MRNQPVHPELPVATRRSGTRARRSLLPTLLLLAGAWLGALPEAMGASAFPQSVASGDPTPSRVVLWTRVEPADPTSEDLPVSLQVATGPDFANVVQERTDLLARGAFDHCVKVAVDGLAPLTTYYYRFSFHGEFSPVGRTKTAPAPDQAVPVRFAVINCQDYVGRYYNTLAHLVQAESNRVDFVVHLGDYIYETTGDPGFQTPGNQRDIVFADAAGSIPLGGPASPYAAAASLDNYRQLYRTYRTDPNLQRLHELYPVIHIWDDHEFANDCWGANSTDSAGRENEFNVARRRHAEQAFFEYLPIDIGRDGHGVLIDDSQLYPHARIQRNFQFGSLLHLFLTDYRSFRPDHLIPEDAFPAAVPMDEATCAALVGSAWPQVRANFDPYVDIDEPAYDALRGAVVALVMVAYESAGLDAVAAQARAKAAVQGRLSARYLNALFVLAGQPTPIPDSSGLPRGLSYLLLGKQGLFTPYGSRYLVPREVFQLYAGFRGLQDPSGQNAYGPTQTAELASALAGSPASWKVVGDSVAFVPLGFDFAHPPVPLPEGFPAELRVNLQLNADDWDGLPLGRKAMLELLAQANAVVISGDIHASFVTRHRTSGGRVVPEFTATSVSSETFREEIEHAARENPATANLTGLPELLGATDLLLADALQRSGAGELLGSRTDANGYLVLQATADSLVAEYRHIPARYVTNDLSGDPALLRSVGDNSLYAVTSTAGGLAVAPAESTIKVGPNTYHRYHPGMTNGAWVYLDADPAAQTPARATQRSLGYREVEYKGAVYPTLAFTAVKPTVSGDALLYDYSSQASKTDLVGFWAGKDLPIVIGPDGLAYFTDGHHTTAGYLAPVSPVRPFIPGLNRVVLGHIVRNDFDALLGAQPVTDAWWLARAGENNAYLFGADGNGLLLPGEPGYDGLRPILPGVLPMPSTPSTLTTNGAVAMLSSAYRSLAWGLADGIVASAFDAAGKKIVGYKKSAPGSSVDINFVEFYWSDFLRHRVVWDDTKTGSPLGSGAGDANLIRAPLGFFAAVANGIALARSEVYRDQTGRTLTAYTNAAMFNPPTVNWASGSLSNGLAKATDTYHLYLLDDSGVVGDIAPSSVSTNLLHVNTVAGLELTNRLLNVRTLLINDGPALATSWKDATVPNSVLKFPSGTGAVTVPGELQVGAITLVSNGVFRITGRLSSPALLVAGGTLEGTGVVAGNVTMGDRAGFAPGSLDQALRIEGALTLAGTTILKLAKSGGSPLQTAVQALGPVTYGGRLRVQAGGEALVTGDRFTLFSAPGFAGAFAEYELPPLAPGLTWDTSHLLVDGSLAVGPADAVPPTIPPLEANLAANVGTAVLLTGGAVGSEPILYRWLFEGTPISEFGPTAVLVVPDVQRSQAGRYFLVAQNAAGTVTNGPSTLAVFQVPSVALTAPVAGSSFSAPANFTLTAAASDLGGVITQVDFYRGATKLGTAVTPPYSLVVSNQPLGTVSYSAVATDDQGVTATSKAVAVTVRKNTNAAPLTLQLLHASDLEASLDAVTDAPAFSSVLAALAATYPTNTLILSSGDNYIPGPFFNAAGDAASGFNGVAGRADIAMLNAMGFQASAFGNHEFDAGTPQVNSLLGADAAVGYAGTRFPYLSANLDFSPDSSLRGRVAADGQDAAGLANKIARSCVISVGGQLIGIVGATTADLRSISSPGAVAVDTNIAARVQAAVDALLPLGVNKVIVLAHLQQYPNEFALAQQLRDVDVVVAGGSHAIFANPTDHLRPGDVASTNYPVWFKTTLAEPVVVVNCGANYHYVGRLVMNFDAAGLIASCDPVSGAYATDPEGQAATGNLPPNPTVQSIAGTLGGVINAKDGNLFGSSAVYLNGRRQSVRTEESNLGDLTADANLWRGRQTDATVSISLKNGGGIRDSIGAVLGYGGGATYVPPLANPGVGKEFGQISQLDIENALRFNNGLALLTVTAQQLRDTMEWGVAAVAPGATPGQFPQVGGVWFSFIPTNPPMTYTKLANGTITGIATPGARLQSLVAARSDGSMDLVVEQGVLIGDPNRTFRMVTLGFLADGGDSYFPLTQATDRVNLAPATGNTFGSDGGEQWALAAYLQQLGLVTLADPPAAGDLRIQNSAARTDTVTWPVLAQLTPQGARVVHFSTLPGKHYEVWAAVDLGAGWFPLSPAPIAGTGFLVAFADPSPESRFRFYRIHRLD